MALRTSIIFPAYPYTPNLTALLRGSNGVLYTVASCGASYNRAELYTSNDGGLTWSQEIFITAAELEAILGGERRITDLAFTVDSHGDIHVLLRAYGTAGSPAPRYPVMYMKRTNGAWSIPIQIEPDNSTYSFWIAIDSVDTAHIAFAHDAGPQMDMYYNSITQAGIWSGNEVVATAAGHSQRHPRVKIGPNNEVYVYWRSRGWGSYPDRDQISCRKRTAGIWGDRIDVTNTNLNHYHNSFTIDRDGVIHFIWNEPATNHFIHRTLVNDTLSAAENCTELNSFALGSPNVCITDAGIIYLLYFRSIIPDVGLRYDIINYLSKIGSLWWGPYTLLSNPNFRDGYPRSMNDYFPLGSPQNINIPTIPTFIYAHNVIPVDSDSFNFAELLAPFVINKAYALSREEL